MSDVSLQDFLTGGARLRAGLAPRLFHLNRPEHREALAALVKENAMSFVVDDYEEQLREYYGVLHPADIFKPSFASEAREYIETLKKNGVLHEHGVWVYYPWNATLVHILDDKEFQMVRTARNKLLITSEEQAMYYNAVVGIAGLSVGNSCALAIALQGGARRLRLADFDLLALSNLNRIRAGVDALGLNKVVMTMRQIYLLNPYAEIEAFPDGLNEGNIDRFFEGPPKLDIVVDEIDNLAIKFLIRERAQKLRLPVVMAADNGDDGVVDVERYDLDQNTPFFHGRMGNVTYESLRSLDKLGIGKTIVQFIGPETVTNRVRLSMPEIGRTLVSWPQLGGAALLNGSAVAYCVRKIVTGQKLMDDRALVSLDALLVPNFNTPEEIQKRHNDAETFRKMFGLN